MSVKGIKRACGFLAAVGKAALIECGPEDQVVIREVHAKDCKSGRPISECDCEAQWEVESVVTSQQLDTIIQHGNPDEATLADLLHPLPRHRRASKRRTGK